MRIRGQEAELLAEVGRELVVDQLLNGLRDSDSGAVRADCAKGLIRCGEAAVTPLIAAYLRSDFDARQRMLHILACMRDPRAAELIRRAAASSVEEQETAVEVLGQLPRSEESTRIVLEAAKSERWQIRRSAAQALPHWNVDIALEVLTTLATDESSHVRESAFEGIARLALTGDDEAPVKVTRALIRMLSGSPEVVRWTISVLKGIGEIETIRRSVRELGPQNLHAREVLNQILETRARERVPELRAYPRQEDAYCLGYARQPITDRVHFSVTAPGVVRAGTPFLLDVWAHLDSERRVVLARAREELRSRNIALRSVGPIPVQRDSSLGVRVSVPSFGFMEEDKLYWAGDISNSSFLILVPAEAKQDVHMGKVELFLGPLKIARLHFNVLVGDFSSEAEDRTLFEERTKTAFASYASEDRDAVLARIQGRLKLLPELDVFLDVIALRSGQEWACRIEDEIVARDTFYLFWSRFARQSEWVDREWHIALERKGLDCIDPVPLEPPTAAPPPPELSCLYFNDWTLAVGSK